MKLAGIIDKINEIIDDIAIQLGLQNRPVPVPVKNKDKREK